MCNLSVSFRTEATDQCDPSHRERTLRAGNAGARRYKVFFGAAAVLERNRRGAAAQSCRPTRGGHASCFLLRPFRKPCVDDDGTRTSRGRWSRHQGDVTFDGRETVISPRPLVDWNIRRTYSARYNTTWRVNACTHPLRLRTRFWKPRVAGRIPRSYRSRALSIHAHVCRSCTLRTRKHTKTRFLPRASAAMRTANVHNDLVVTQNDRYTSRVIGRTIRAIRFAADDIITHQRRRKNGLAALRRHTLPYEKRRSRRLVNIIINTCFTSTVELDKKKKKFVLPARISVGGRCQLCTV